MIANITLGAGAALFGVGAILVLTSGGSKTQEVVRLSPQIGPGLAALELSGDF
jgi:hypothetical protein